MIRHPEVSTSENLAGEPGFEPGLRGPEPRVLPLDDSPASDVTESKSSPPPGLLSGIIPLNLPQKRAGIVKLLQSQLYNPRTPYHILPQLALKYQPLKLTSPLRQSLYILPTTPDRPLATVLAVLPRHAFDDAPESASIEATLTLPESAMEVALC